MKRSRGFINLFFVSCALVLMSGCLVPVRINASQMGPDCYCSRGGFWVCAFGSGSIPSPEPCVPNCAYLGTCSGYRQLYPYYPGLYPAPTIHLYPSYRHNHGYHRRHR